MTQLRNASWVLVSEFFRKGVLYLCMVLAARSLGVEGFGAFSAVMAAGALFAIAADLGMADFAVREVALRPGEGSRVVAELLGLRIALLAGVVAVAGGLAMAGAASLPVAALLLAVLYYGLSATTQLGIAVFRANERMDLEALARVVEFSVLFALLAWSLRAPRSLEGTIGLFVASSVVGLAAAFVLNARRFAVLRPAFRPAAWLPLARAALPFALSIGLFLVYYRSLVLVLARLAGDEQAGLFNAAFQFMLGAFVLPFGVASATYPLLTRSRDDPAAFRRLLGRSLALVLALALVASVVLYAAAPLVLRLVYGPEYVEATAAFRVLVAAFPFTFTTTVLAVALQARGRAGVVSLAAGLNLAVSLAIGLLLAPRLGALGSAWALFVAEGLSVAWMGLGLRHRRPAGDGAAPATSVE